MINLKLIAGLGAVILLLSTLLAVSLSETSRVKSERDQAIQYTKSTQDTLVRRTTKLGQESVRSKSLGLSLNVLQQLREDDRIAWVKQFEGVHKRMNNLEQISSTTAIVSAEFKTGLKDTLITTNRFLSSVDSSSSLGTTFLARTFDNKDKWIHITGLIFPDTVIINATAEVVLQSVLYWERKKWPKIKVGKKDFGPRWGRKEWFKETTSPNTYITITKDELIQVGSKKKLKKQ